MLLVTYRSIHQCFELVSRDGDLDDGTVEELLFGWFEGRNREGRKQRSSRCLLLADKGPGSNVET